MCRKHNHGQYWVLNISYSIINILVSVKTCQSFPCITLKYTTKNEINEINFLTLLAGLNSLDRIIFQKIFYNNYYLSPGTTLKSLVEH